MNFISYTIQRVDSHCQHCQHTVHSVQQQQQRDYPDYLEIYLFKGKKLEDTNLNHSR